MSRLVVPDPIRELLAANLLEERDLVESVGLSGIEEQADRPGHGVSWCVVPVRRAFDPETAEMRRLEVSLVRLDDERWQIESIAGLSNPTAEA